MENFNKKNIENADAIEKKFREKYIKYGDLGITAEDHLSISSTPDDLLIKNPGKTLGEIMSDEEIEKFLTELKNYVEGEEDKEHMIKFQERQRKNLEACISYLRSIERLPESFK